MQNMDLALFFIQKLWARDGLRGAASMEGVWRACARKQSARLDPVVLMQWLACAAIALRALLLLRLRTPATCTVLCGCAWEPIQHAEGGTDPTRRGWNRSNTPRAEPIQHAEGPTRRDA